MEKNKTNKQIKNIVTLVAPSFHTSSDGVENFNFILITRRKQQDRAAKSLLSLQEVHVCSLIVGWLYLYRNNASDALFFVQFYVHASVGF